MWKITDIKINISTYLRNILRRVEHKMCKKTSTLKKNLPSKLRARNKQTEGKSWKRSYKVSEIYLLQGGNHYGVVSQDFIVNSVKSRTILYSHFYIISLLTYKILMNSCRNVNTNIEFAVFNLTKNMKICQN